MSNLDNIEPPVLESKEGTLHPINQTKKYLLKLLKILAFKKCMGLKLKQKNLILIC